MKGAYLCFYMSSKPRVRRWEQFGGEETVNYKGINSVFFPNKYSNKRIQWNPEICEQIN